MFGYFMMFASDVHAGIMTICCQKLVHFNVNIKNGHCMQVRIDNASILFWREFIIPISFMLASIMNGCSPPNIGGMENKDVP